MGPEIRAELEEHRKNGPLAGMHSALQSSAAGRAAPGGAEGVGSFDLASWMAGVQKGQQGVTSGADVREGPARRKRDVTR